MAEPYEATDSSSLEPVAPEVRNSDRPPAEKEYRLYNTSGQTLYVVNSDGTHALPPREYYDLPFTKLSHHIKLMARRGFITLFEKEKEET
jgi:hypothetical protein